eukprot:GHVU01025694.1.p1 GENE.GHVU01025694.1~~GHVU01025694.1.p1  ORF type:complete len:103 (+),score=7.07 GHVU01025694.1:188-496(+)
MSYDNVVCHFSSLVLVGGCSRIDRFVSNADDDTDTDDGDWRIIEDWLMSASTCLMPAATSKSKAENSFPQLPRWLERLLPLVAHRETYRRPQRCNDPRPQRI